MRTTAAEMLVVLDEHPSSTAGLRFAEQHAHGFLTLASRGVDTADLDEMLTSAAAEASIDEALATAARRGIPTVALRRDLAEPRQLLADLVRATGRHCTKDVPGFAVVLADDRLGPIRRILAIADQRTATLSGMTVNAAVAMAHRTAAVLDVLVIGRAGLDDTSAEGFDLLAVGREQQLFAQAVDRARDNDLAVNWLPVAGVTDPWAVVRDQLGQADYDLVVDDLGDVRLGGRLRGRTPTHALGRGEVGEVPLHLLTEVPVPLMLVLDGIRLGTAPRSILKVGTAAALAAGLIAPAALTSASPAPADAAAGAGAVEALVADLEAALTVATDDPSGPEAQAERASAAATSSRGLSVGARTAAQDQAGQATAAPGETTAAAPKAPKGGATPADVAKARAKSAKAKAALAQEKALRDEAKSAATTAEQDLAAAQQEGQAALVGLQEATEATDRANRQVEALRLGPTVEGSVVPAAPTEEELAIASAVEESAQEQLDEAVTTGEEALEALAAAEEDLAAATAEAAIRRDTVAETRADYLESRERLTVYLASLARTRQPPVAAGSYRLTARFGQAGGYWSGGVHTGLDFAGSTGTDITAAASGTVVEVGYAGAYGNRIVVDHGKGVRTAYNHLSATRVRVGQEVSTGDHIGDMGATGNTTGTHLHFEVTRDGAFVDPEAWLGW